MGPSNYYLKNNKKKKKKKKKKKIPFESFTISIPKKEHHLHFSIEFSTLSHTHHPRKSGDKFFIFFGEGSSYSRKS